ncbi:MAG: hypothetical protein WBL84_22815 [Xanthobacteraceae bacterium]
MIATGLPLVMVGSGGRDSQSNTFFNTPGIEKLYSGVTTSSASARPELLAKRDDRRRETPILDVAVVLRNVADACDLDGHAGGRELAGRPQQRGVVGLRPQAAGNPEHIDAIGHELHLELDDFA